MSGGSVPAIKVNLRTIIRVNPTMRGFRSALSAKLVLLHSVRGGGTFLICSSVQYRDKVATGEKNS